MVIFFPGKKNNNNKKLIKIDKEKQSKILILNLR